MMGATDATGAGPGARGAPIGITEATGAPPINGAAGTMGGIVWGTAAGIAVGIAPGTPAGSDVGIPNAIAGCATDGWAM